MESIYFKFSDKVTRSSKVDKAHLWLYIQNQQPTPSQPIQQPSGNHHHQQAQVISKSANANASTVWIHIYKVVRVPDGESPILNPVRMTRVALPPLLELIEKVPASSSSGSKHNQQSGGWVSFEVRKVVADWFRWPEDNLGLVVHAVHGDHHGPPPSFTVGGGPAPAPTPSPPPSSSSSNSKSVPFIVNDYSHADGALVSIVWILFNRFCLGGLIFKIQCVCLEYRCHLLKWWRRTDVNTGRNGQSVWIATRLRLKRVAVVIHWRLISWNSVGIGSSLLKSTRPIIVRANALTSSYRNIRTRTLCNRQIRLARPVRVAPRVKCRPFQCSTLTTNSTLFTAICLEWSSIDAAALKEFNSIQQQQQRKRTTSL